MKNEEKKVMVNFEIPLDLKEAFKKKCESEGRSMVWYLQRFIEELVND